MVSDGAWFDIHRAVLKAIHRVIHKFIHRAVHRAVHNAIHRACIELFMDPYIELFVEACIELYKAQSQTYQEHVIVLIMKFTVFVAICGDSSVYLYYFFDIYLFVIWSTCILTDLYQLRVP